MFMLSNIGSYATEGVTFSFDVTPESALLVDKRIRWEIIFRGDIPAFSSDFISMSGDLDFVSGATASQTITLSIADDNSYEVDREFVIRVWDTNNTADDISDDTQIGEDAVVILQDDDTNNFTNSVNAFTGLGDNTFTAASSIFLNFVSANGDDSFIITRFQYGDVRINDTAGSSYIKFDRGVTIEVINEEVVSFGGREVTSVDLILSTGSTITIEAPTKPEFQYQLGDSRVLDYGDFISTLGTVSASLPYVVTGSSTVATPDDGFRNVIGLYRTVGDDIMGLGSDFDLNVTGGLGDDSFIITRFQTGDVSINDVAGSSYIKFDRGVTIVSVYETVFDLGVREVTSVDLILSTGSTINIDAPTKLAFQYQFGDGVLLNYEDFASALSSVVVSVAGDVSSDRYVVGGVIFGAGPYHYSVSENLDASGVGNAMVLGSISATVTSGETLNYAFDGGTLTDSLGHFAITSVGEISYIGSGLDGETTSVHYLKVQATSSDGSVDVANISIEVVNVNEAPVSSTIGGIQTVTIGVDLDISSFFGDGDVASSGDELTYTAMRVDSNGVNPTALPSGLSINADTGIFSASTSAVSGVTYRVEVTATDSGGLSVVSNVFALYVNTAPIVVTGQEISDRTLELGVADTITIADSNNAASNVFSDADTGDTLSYSVTFSDGSPLPDGVTFVTSNGDATLVFADTVVAGVYDFIITATDTHNVSVTESFSVTVNTPPHFSSPDAITFTNNDSTVTEDDSTDDRVSGALSFSDVDTGDTLATLSLHATNDGTVPTASNGLLTFTSDGTDSTASIDGIYGTFTFTRDATTSAVTWTYLLDSTDSDTNTLGSGAMETESVQLLVRDDGNAVSSVETLTVNITGFNDVPIVSNSIDNATITLADSHVVTIADSNNTASNVFSDADTGDTLSYSATFSDGSSLSGGITFVTSNGVTQLSFGTTVVLGVYELAVTATDSQSLSVTETFTVTVSTNIAPAFSSTNAITFTNNDFTVTEDDSTDNRVSGALSFNDVDSGDTLASLLLHATSDGTPPTVSIGLLTFALGEAFVVGVYGTFTFMRDATTSAVTWRYDLDNADSDTNALDVGATATDSVQLLVRDDGGSVSPVVTFSVTVVGSNDAPVFLSNGITFTNTDSTVTEDDSTDNRVSGALAFSDVDTGDTLATLSLHATNDGMAPTASTGLLTFTSDGTDSTASIDGVYGAFTFTRDAMTSEVTWTYELDDTDSDTNALDFGVSVTESVQLLVRDDGNAVSSVVTLSVTVVGSNDAPVVSTIGTASIDEGTLSVNTHTGSVFSFSDPEGDTYRFTVDDSRFAVEVDANNNDNYHLVATVNSVFDYETEPRIIVVITATNTTDASEVYTRSTTVSIVNVYEAPVFSTGTSSESIDIDENIGTTVSIYTALATADALATSSVVVYTLGGTDAALFNIDTSSGVVTFKVSPDYESGKTHYVFDVIATTNQPTPMSATRSVELFIQDVNDAPVFSSPSAITFTNTDSTVTEDDSTDNRVSGALSFSDVDDTLADISLHATNDGTPPTASIGELTFALGEASIRGTYGTFTFMRDATTSAVTWTYLLDNTDSDTNALDSGVFVTESVQLLVRDDDNAVSSVETLTVNIEGSNDAPAFSSTSAITFTNTDSTVTEDDFTDDRVSGALSFSDVDDTLASLSLHATNDGTAPTASTGLLTFTSGEVSIVGTYGTFTFMRDATTSAVTWTYELDDTDSDTNALGSGVFVTESVQLLVRDDGGAVSSVETLSVTVVGSNDALVLSNAIDDDIFDPLVGGSITIADSNNTASNVFSDVDTGDTLTYTLQIEDATGTFVDTLPFGITWDSTTGDEALIFADTVALGVYNFKLTAEDSGGLSVTTDIFRVTVSTAPVVANAIGNKVFSPGVSNFAFAQDTFTDADTGDTLAYTALLVNADGSVSSLPTGLSFTPSTRTFNIVTTLDVGIYTIRVTATDPQGLSVTDTFSVTVSTAPVIVNSISDKIYAPNVSGTITIADSNDTTSNVFSDADTGDTLTYLLEIEDANAMGTFVNASPSSLPSGVTWSDNGTGDVALIFSDTVALGVYNFQLTATDSQSLSVTEAFRVTVDTAPAFSSNAITNNNSTVTEDDLTNNRVSGALSFSDVDSDDTLASLLLHATNDGTDPTASIGLLTFTSGEASVVGLYGTFTFTRDATTSAVTWTYVLNNSNSMTDALDVGDSVTESVRLLVRDMRDVVSSVVTLSVTVVGSYDAPDITVSGTAIAIDEGTLTADRDTGFVVSASAQDGDTYTYTVDDSRFELRVSDNHLIAQSGAVFDFEAEPSVNVVITATNDADSSEVYQASTTISITNVYEAPVFSLGTSSSGTPLSVTNIAPNVTPTTNVTSWATLGDVDTPEEHIANINDGDLTAVAYGSAVFVLNANDKHISFALGGDYGQGSFIYHNRNDGAMYVLYSVNGSTVDFIKDGVSVYSEVIANAGEIVTITAPVDTLFDTARITFSGDLQNFREIEVFGRRVGSELFTINENIDTTVSVYTASATADALATRSVVYTLGGTDANSFNISSGVVTFIASPDYETKAYYVFDVIATTDQPSTVSATRRVELFIQDVEEPATINLTDPDSTFSITEGTALTADRDTGSVLSFSDPEGEPFSFTTNDSRFALDSNNHLIAQSGAVFDYEAGARIDVVITATNNADASEVYTRSTTISITNVYDAPVFSAGTSSGTITSVTNLALNLTSPALDTDIEDWVPFGDVNTPEEQIANINDGVTAVQGYAVYPLNADDKYIRFALGGDYGQGKFVYYNRNDGFFMKRVNGSTVDFIKDGVTVYSEVIANAEDNTDDIVTITAPVDTLFDTARITFSGDFQNFREIEVLGRPENSFNIDENIDIADLVYTASATADALATSAVVYRLGGTDATLFNIDTSSGEMTFIASPDYETKDHYVFDVIATTNQPTPMSATRHVELFIQDVEEPATINLTASTIAIDEGTLSADSDTGSVFSFSDPDGEGDIYTYTVDDSRFKLVQDNSSATVVYNLTAKDGAVFDYETEPSVIVVITATNDANANETYQESTTISINDVHHAPVFSTGTSSSGTITSVTNLALNLTSPALDTDIEDWVSFGDVDTPEEHIANINDGVLTAVRGYAVYPEFADGKYISFALGGDYVQGSFIYHNRNDGYGVDRVNGSTVDFIKNGTTVYSKEIAYAGNIVTITAPVDTVFDTVHIVFSGESQNFREIEVFGHRVGSFDIDENIDTTVSVYTASATADATATSAVAYTLGGTDAGDFNIDTSSGDVTFKVSPDYETKPYYVFDVIATTTDGNTSASATHRVELLIQDVYEAPMINLTDPASTFSITEGTLTADSDTGSVFSFSDPEGDAYRFTTNDSRFVLDSNNHLIAQSGAVFDYEAGSRVDVVITATNTADTNETYQETTTVSITNVYDAPVFSEGTSSGTRRYTYNLALNLISPARDTNIEYWYTDGNSTLTAEHIVKINDGDTDGSTNSSLVSSIYTDGKYILFALGGDYVQGFFIYYNRNDGYGLDRVNGSTVAFIKDGVTVYSEVIANASYIETITAPEGTVFDTARITFSGENQNLREIEVVGRLVGSELFNIDENIETTVPVYTPSTTADTTATSAVVYSLGGTDVALFNIDTSSGVVTFIASPDYETKLRYSFDVIVTTTDSSSVSLSATRRVELFIQDVNDAPVVANPIENQRLNEGANLDFTLPSNVFSDTDTGDTLTYTAVQADTAGSALPSWISFNDTTGNFSGTAPSVTSAGDTISIRVTATDTSSASVYDDFDILILDVV